MMWSSSRAIAGAVAALTLLMPSAVAADADTADADTTEPRFKTVLEDYWFHGDPNDQVNKQERLLVGVTDTPLDSRSPTFDQNAPTGNEHVAQTSYLMDHVPTVQTSPGEAWAIYWVGDVAEDAGSGVARETEGDLEIRWFWRSTAPAVLGRHGVTITVWADPDWERGTGTLIGGLDRTFVYQESPTTQSVTRVPVQGTVEEQLLIQVTPWSSIPYAPVVLPLSLQTEVLYDSTEFDSGFTVPFRVPCEDNDPDPECATVTVGEAASSGPGGSEDEYVEVRAVSEEPVDIGGWSVQACDAAGSAATVATFEEETTLAPEEPLLLAGPGYAGSRTPHATYDRDVPGEGGWRVVDGVGTVVDSVGSGGSSRPATCAGSTTTGRHAR